MAGAAGGTGDSPGDWTGVCVQRVQDSAVAVDWCVEAGGGGLEADADRVDFFICDRDAGVVGGGVWKMAGGSGAAAGDVCSGGLLWAGSLNFVFRSGDAPIVAPVSGLRICWWNRAGPWIHFAGVDANQVVSGSAGIGDRHGDHGIWRRGDDRIAAVDQID